MTLALAAGLLFGCAGGGGSGGGTGGSAGGAPGAGGAGAIEGGGASGAGAGGVAGGSGGVGGGAAGQGGGGQGGTSAGGGPCRAGLLFCDDFESAGATPDPTRWSTYMNGDGTITVDGTTPAHSGTKSVHVHGTGYETFLMIKGAPVFPAPNGRMYLRLYIRLDLPMTGGHNTFFEAGLDGMPDDTDETRVGEMNAMLMINQPDGDRGFLSNPTYYQDGMKPGVVFTPKVWTCVEALFDAPHTEVDIWVDGTEVPALHRTDWKQDPFNEFRIGFEAYAGPAADIWYDDIAADTSQIGCD
jgi:hypothetical protein